MDGHNVLHKEGKQKEAEGKQSAVQVGWGCCENVGIRLQWGLWRETKAAPLGAHVI